MTHGRGLLLHNARNTGEFPVTPPPGHGSVILDRTGLNSGQRVNEIRKLGRPGAPAHGQYTIVAAAVAKSVGSVDGRAGIVADNNDTPRLNERKHAVVLQQYGTGCADLPDDCKVIVLDVDVLVR